MKKKKKKKKKKCLYHFSKDAKLLKQLEKITDLCRDIKSVDGTLTIENKTKTNTHKRKPANGFMTNFLWNYSFFLKKMSISILTFKSIGVHIQSIVFRLTRRKESKQETGWFLSERIKCRGSSIQLRWLEPSNSTWHFLGHGTRSHWHPVSSNMLEKRIS